MIFYCNHDFLLYICIVKLNTKKVKTYRSNYPRLKLEFIEPLKLKNYGTYNPNIDDSATHDC